MSPDGRFLYSISSQDYAIACIARQADGGIAYAGATDLTSAARREPGYERCRWVSLALSPDGQWLYAAVFNGRLGRTLREGFWDAQRGRS